MILFFFKYAEPTIALHLVTCDKLLRKITVSPQEPRPPRQILEQTFMVIKGLQITHAVGNLNWKV